MMIQNIYSTQNKRRMEALSVLDEVNSTVSAKTEVNPKNMNKLIQRSEKFLSKENLLLSIENRT